MSNNYRWKNSATTFISLLSRAGSKGSDEDPIRFYSAINGNLMFSSGYHNFFSGSVKHIKGMGKYDTVFKDFRGYEYSGSVSYLNINAFSSDHILGLSIDNSIISGVLYKNITKIERCIITKDQNFFTNSANYNSFLGLKNIILSTLKSNMSVYCNSNIILTQADLNNHKLLYMAFNNCTFKIGTMTEYEQLKGDTEDDLRNSFVQLCVKGGISETSIPKGSELGDINLPMYRWVFSNEPNNHGCVTKDSIIDKFQQRRLIRFGWNLEPVLPIEITTDSRKINSLSLGNDKILIDNDLKSIRLAEDVDISDIKNEGQQTASIRSNIIWLGEGKQKVSSVNITHNLATQYGVMIDSDPAIVPIDNQTPIEVGEMYLVRSKTAAKETITYNGKTYSTAKSDNNNIFVGVDKVTTWSGSENIIIYKITDLAICNTIRMRIVDSVPEDEVKTIEKDVWYFVEPLDSSNPSGHIVYNGAEYPCMGSFKGEAISSFTINGNCRLRRCWKDGFTIDNQSDSTFWTDKQKPIWFNVVPDDMRCILKNNNPLSIEMEYDENLKTYITSGHPDFYAMIAADNGISMPPYSITGKYMQIEIVISTLNPM